MIESVRIKLAALWVAVTLTYVLQIVLRISSGEFAAGEIQVFLISQGMYLGMAIVMMAPIAMVYLSLSLNYKANRWSNVILALFFFGVNLISLLTYPSLYHKFLIDVGLVFNLLVIWHAWEWPEPEIGMKTVTS
ncbi:MAG: hypothetical protein DWQ07_11000 [Chloroflexi bacterium]|nr:MAG: hypothetical protein DWQ07_11000 [Chloroflexota bacterium]MBL1192758.1 hypothetical protein [Chloroflexota bacterium]NOH10052.1 hypothetical protein [Chloroflexota bacterium]